MAKKAVYIILPDLSELTLVIKIVHKEWIRKIERFFKGAFPEIGVGAKLRSEAGVYGCSGKRSGTC
jgi:hypothetical protein